LVQLVKIKIVDRLKTGEQLTNCTIELHCNI